MASRRKIIWKEDIVEGIENAPKAFIGLNERRKFWKTSC